jgi:thiamine phosphate synthase YjbQ (UPF0047 family)
MPVFQKTIRLSTKGNCDVLDITARVASIVAGSGIHEGIVNVAGKGSTLASISTVLP